MIKYTISLKENGNTITGKLDFNNVTDACHFITSVSPGFITIKNTEFDYTLIPVETVESINLVSD